MKGLAAGVLAGAMSLGMASAPMQCKRDPDPNGRIEDTAGDALWALALKFEGEHNDASAKETLQYLVDRYPSNRHAPEARAKLGGAAAPVATAAAADGG
jgi:hypothetical protein